MAKIKHKTSNRAKTAHAPPRTKVGPRGAAGGSRNATAKPAAKAKAKAKAIIVAKKSMKSAVPRKGAAKATPKGAARKAAVKKPPAKKNAAVKPIKKVTKPLKHVKSLKQVKQVKQVKSAPVRKAAPAKTAKVKKPVIAKAATSDTPIRNAQLHRKFVTNSKPETISVPKSKARAMPPSSEYNVTMQDGRYALPATTRIDLPNGYKPSPKDEYMSPPQLQYFRNKLSKWREDLVEESRQTIESLRDEVRDVGDEAERATRETENSLELRTRDRYRKLIAKIDKALKRIEEGHYGFCEETDEDIGIDRLEARPIATLSLDAQERWEHRQKQMGD